jgi:HK97 family phage portal protein
VRSPVGELVALFSRPRNDAPVPYVGRSGYTTPSSSATGDQAGALEATGRNGTLFSIVNKLSTSTAAVRWHMHRKTGIETDICPHCDEDDPDRVGVVVVDQHPALSIWNKPNDFFTPMLFVESSQQHVELVGESWWVVAYLAGRPIELWLVRPDRMAPVRDPKAFIRGYVYRSPDGQMVPLKLNEVIQIRMPAPWDPYRGAGAVQTIMNDLWGAEYAAAWNRRFFENSAIPGGIVEMPAHLSDSEWDEFQQRWADAHRGVSNAHTVATLEYGAKWIDVKYTQRDMEFAELNRVSREVIREAFAIHGHILGLSENVNRANAEAADVTYARGLIQPRAERLKDALNGPFLKLFKGMGTREGYAFAYGGVVPQDREGDNAERLSKAQTFETLRRAGVHPDDAAQIAGLPPLRTVEVQAQPQVPDVHR